MDQLKEKVFGMVIKEYQMGKDMKVIGKMIKKMEEEFIIIIMVRFMMVIGKKE